ncbi:expressed unknown protein [Seminavis robusta]|uniref:Uncharacterized protein n=1 Tax=Seminavis robusta TaxID=568900 RepID=A0A9N8HU30_9STRA|nr:expressed unknown protein [Seminavis robusta]|eukprot:Sro1339_g264330.1 n/a (241) ;mRNA; f:24156-24878
MDSNATKKRPADDDDESNNNNNIFKRQHVVIDDNKDDSQEQQRERSWDPIMGEWVEEESEEEEEPVYEYKFQNSEAFLAALEVYNRRGCTIQEELKYGKIPVTAVYPSYHWICRQVAGRHRHCCDECREDFTTDAKYYLIDESSGGKYRGAKGKLCLPCMDQLLYDECDETTDLKTIKEMLGDLRKEHNGVVHDMFITPYEKKYPVYATFLSHCKNNDENKAGELARQMMTIPGFFGRSF